jgi:hypothetical protein
MHRMTIGKLRREIQSARPPTSSAICSTGRVQPERNSGPEGLRIIRQLQG